MGGLQRRQRMLVDELNLPSALEHEAELIEPGDGTLEHDAIDEEQGHSFRLPRRSREEKILQWRLAPLLRRAARHEVGWRLHWHDGQNGMLVHQLRCAFASQLKGEGIK